MFCLYKNKKLIAYFYCWEDAVDFIEELKNLNHDFIDRRNFKIISNNGSNEIIKEWYRK